jgi:HlyD family secretion protein
LKLSGRIEAPETFITAAMPARVMRVEVKEGDAVHKGQLILSLNAQLIQDKIKQVDSGIAEAQSAERLADLQVKAVRGEIGKARAHAGDAQAQTMLQVQTAQSDISKARSESKGFWAHIFSTKKKKEEKTAQLKQEMTQAEMQAHSVQSGIAETTAQLRQEMTQAQIQKFQALAMVAKAKAAKKEVSSKLSYFNITSPLNGICEIRSTEPGELASKGQVLLTLTNPESAYLRGFISEGRIGEVTIGQRAQVFLDSNRNKPFSARVTSIDRAESFTPENVYFKKDRVRQVFGVKLSIDHPGGFAKPGMPANAQIMLSNRKNPG